MCLVVSVVYATENSQVIVNVSYETSVLVCVCFPCVRGESWKKHVAVYDVLT